MLKSTIKRLRFAAFRIIVTAFVLCFLLTGCPRP